MADDLTTKQETVTAKFFQLFLDNNWNPSDEKYTKLLSDCFGDSGIMPLGSSKVDIDWRNNFDKQCLALQQYMISRSIPATGWKWSRGDGMMSFLNGIAQNRCGVTGSLDSWNPMDVVGVKTTKEQALRSQIEADVIRGVAPSINKDILNSIMIEAIQKKELMPVSLKKINAKERPAMELSEDLKGNNAKLKSKHYFNYENFMCDLEWNSDTNEWKNAQEISWDMNDKGGVIRAPYYVHVQARAFQGKKPREKPQHSLAAKGAGAMLGKSSIAPLDEYVKNMGFRPVPSPSQHRYIPNAGQPWRQTQINYWTALYQRLKGVTISGQKIKFGTPGAYGSKGVEKGFEAALKAAILADQDGLKTPNSRSAGSRLTAKLWGLEWLSRYNEISKRGKFDQFAYQLYKASTKQLPGTGPFIKVFGQTGRSRKEIKKHIETLEATNIDWDNL
tara:strand:- start:292 stop:1629 length:1338 start_codon:yes stop_codon:yes gene_type:complete